MVTFRISLNSQLQANELTNTKQATFKGLLANGNGKQVKKLSNVVNSRNSQLTITDNQLKIKDEQFKKLGKSMGLTLKLLVYSVRKTVQIVG